MDFVEALQLSFSFCRSTKTLIGRRRLAELECCQLAPQEADYEDLEREYAKLVEDSKRFIRMLKDKLETLHGFAVDYELDLSGMHNADEVTAKLLATTGILESPRS